MFHRCHSRSSEPSVGLAFRDTSELVRTACPNLRNLDHAGHGAIGTGRIAGSLPVRHEVSPVVHFRTELQMNWGRRWTTTTIRGVGSPDAYARCGKSSGPA